MKTILNLNYDENYPNICNLDMYLPITNKTCPFLSTFMVGL